MLPEEPRAPMGPPVGSDKPPIDKPPIDEPPMEEMDPTIEIEDLRRQVDELTMLVMTIMEKVDPRGPGEGPPKEPPPAPMGEGPPPMEGPPKGPPKGPDEEALRRAMRG